MSFTLSGPAFGETVPEVQDAMSALAESDHARGSRRAIFLKLYLGVTNEVPKRAATGFFEDGVWGQRLLVDFANLYARARFDYDRGAADQCPKAWRLAFRTADAQTGLLLQDLLLGVNAHINHDLAFSLASIGVDPHRDSRYRDHTRVNTILEDLTGPSQDEITALYAPGLSLAADLAEPISEIAAAFSIAKARESAWQHAVSLVNAGSDFERGLVRQGLQWKSAILAKAILAPTRLVPALVPTFRAVEQGYLLGY